MADQNDFYLVWSGALNMGDTPGVFTDAQFVGLMLQIPISITFVEEKSLTSFLLETTEVEIFNGKKHPIYWDWVAGTNLPSPVGFIDDSDLVAGKPEFHLVEVPLNQAQQGRHTLTILVNAEVPAGLKDDFVLRRMQAHNSIGARIGW